MMVASGGDGTGTKRKPPPASFVRAPPPPTPLALFLGRSARRSWKRVTAGEGTNGRPTDRPNVARVVCERPMDDLFFALHCFHRPRTVTMTLALSSYRAGNSRISSRPVSMQERLHSAPLERGGGGRVAGDGDAQGAMRPIRK